MAFDPDAYLSVPSPAATAPAGGFDPDAYLKTAAPVNRTTRPVPGDPDFNPVAAAPAPATMGPNNVTAQQMQIPKGPLASAEDYLSRLPGRIMGRDERVTLGSMAQGGMEMTAALPQIASEPVAKVGAKAGQVLEDLGGKLPNVPGPITTVKNLYSGYKGEGTKKALGELADSVKSGKFAEDILSGKRSATEATINQMRASKMISDEQAAKAIEDLKTASKPQLVQLRGMRDEATQQVEKVTQEFQAAPMQAQVGESILGRVNNYIKGLRGNRADLASALYADADAAMAAKHEAGDVWQQSASGQDFIAGLRERLSLEGGNKITSEERRFIEDQLLPNLEGRATPGAAGGLTEQGGNLVIQEPAAGEMAYSRPEVLRETLRKLRDAASGKPEEGYAAIGQQRAGKLANSLAAAIEKWEPSLAEADNQYRTLSEALNPAKTAIGKRALGTEKFDHETLAADPSSIPTMFFKTPATVKQLITLSGGDVAAVEQNAVQYAFRQLAGKKTPEAAQEWLQGQEWLAALPNARKAVEQRVGQWAAATSHAEAATSTLKGAATSYAERAGTIKEPAAEFGKEASKMETEARQALAKFQEPIAALIDNVRTGVITESELPGKMRDFIGRIPPSQMASSVKKTLVKQIEEIERIENRERRIQTWAAWARNASAAAVGGGVVSALTHPYQYFMGERRP